MKLLFLFLILSLFYCVESGPKPPRLQREMEIRSFVKQSDSEPKKVQVLRDRGRMDEILNLYRQIPKDCGMFQKLSGLVPLVRVSVFEMGKQIQEIKIYGSSVQCANTGFLESNLEAETKLIKYIREILERN